MAKCLHCHLRQISFLAVCILKRIKDDNDQLLSVPKQLFFLGKYNEQKQKTTPNTAVPCPSGDRSVRICEVCCLVMDKVLTSMPSVPPLALLGMGESTVSSWKTDVETSSCLLGLNEIQQKIRSETKQNNKITYRSILHPMVKRYVNFNVWCGFVCLFAKSGDVLRDEQA